MPHAIRLLSLFGLAFLVAGCASVGLADNPDELERTWARARVVVRGPDGFIGGHLSDATVKTALAALPSDLKARTIIYMHGCTGLRREAGIDIDRLAQAGYAVIALDSFARSDRRANCDPATGTSDHFLNAFAYRDAEIRYAARRARETRWVDSENLVVLGFSEGGHAVALYEGPEYAAYVITGWTCHNRHPNFRHLHGLHVPKGKPVLALVGSRDPWYQNPWHNGDCGPFIDRRSGRSVVVDAAVHHVTWYPDAAKVLLDFLATHTKRP